ncbi:MAG: hypothetical protein JSV23_09270, partial [Promethearchaeota archaeon]
MSSEFLYIGHRGTRTDCDENTIDAFKRALEFGANYIEFDVRKTKDGKIIIMHDSTLDRTTTGSGLLKSYNYNEIKRFRTKIKNSYIPLFSEVLKELSGKTKFMIELKENNLRDILLKIVKKNYLLGDCIFSGRSLQDLGYIKQIYPNSKICYNITKGLGFNINDFLKLSKHIKFKVKPDLISLRSKLISSEFIKICHENDIKSLAWDFFLDSDPISRI